MIPGEIIPATGSIALNETASTVTLKVANTGDRPVQVGSHYHFFETNPALEFDRKATRGMRLDIAAGTAVRFEPGQARDVTLVPFGGKREIYGFNSKVMENYETRICKISVDGHHISAYRLPRVHRNANTSGASAAGKLQQPSIAIGNEHLLGPLI